MNRIDTLDYVNSKFIYVSDQDQFRFRDVWRIMSPEKMNGDCEDYALTVLWHLADKKPLKALWWLLSRKAKILFWRHRERKTGHASLEFEDKMVDNLTRYWHAGGPLEQRGYKFILGLPVIFVVLKLLVSLPFMLFRK